MKCRHIIIVCRVAGFRYTNTLYLCILVHHISWEMWIKFPQVVLLLPVIPCRSLQAAASIHHVCSSLLFYLPCLLLQISHQSAWWPVFLLEWKRDRIKWRGVEKFGILSEYPCTLQPWLFRVFGWTYPTQFLWIALIHQIQ